MQQFKPFQKVIVYSEATGVCFPDIYQRTYNGGHYVLGCRYPIADDHIKPYPRTDSGYQDPDEIVFNF